MRDASTYFKPIDNSPQISTSQDVARRKLPVIPLTTVAEDRIFSRILLSQDNLSIINTPTDKRTLPQTPIERAISNSQLRSVMLNPLLPDSSHNRKVAVEM